MLDWYTEQAIERHKELIREVERHSRFLEAVQSESTDAGVRVRLLAGLGHWMVEQGHRLEAQHEMSGNTADAC